MDADIPHSLHNLSGFAVMQRLALVMHGSLLPDKGLRRHVSVVIVANFLIPNFSNYHSHPTPLHRLSDFRPALQNALTDRTHSSAIRRDHLGLRVGMTYHAPRCTS